MSQNTACKMPDHGLATATAACCRPEDPAFMGMTPDAGSPLLRFWSERDTWKRASKTTLSCLIGCMIGDFSMIIFLQAFFPGTSMWLTMGLAMGAGLLTSIAFESALLRFKEGMVLRQAVRTAIGMSFISMLGMELAANTTDLLLTGGGRLHFSDPWYWGALAISLVVGFLAPLPYNYFKLQKYGKACH